MKFKQDANRDDFLKVCRQISFQSFPKVGDKNDIISFYSKNK